MFWGFWTITQEPDFGKHAAFAKSTKKIIGTLYWSKKARLNGQDFCQNPKNVNWGIFKPSKPSPFELIFKNWDPSLFLPYDVKLHEKKKKIEKTDDPEILHCRQMGKRTKPNW